MSRGDRHPTIIGASELVLFPAWNIGAIRAKVDTGAKTSALHVDRLRFVRAGRVRFDIQIRRDDPLRCVTVEAPIKRRGRVRSSNGHMESRVFVEAKIRLGRIERVIELGLVDREKMRFRMLLGRSALSQQFLVDVSQRYVLGRAHASTPVSYRKNENK